MVWALLPVIPAPGLALTIAIVLTWPDFLLIDKTPALDSFQDPIFITTAASLLLHVASFCQFLALLGIVMGNTLPQSGAIALVLLRQSGSRWCPLSPFDPSTPPTTLQITHLRQFRGRLLRLLPPIAASVTNGNVRNWATVLAFGSHVKPASGSVAKQFITAKIHSAKQWARSMNTLFDITFRHSYLPISVEIIHLVNRSLLTHVPVALVKLHELCMFLDVATIMLTLRLLTYRTLNLPLLATLLSHPNVKVAKPFKLLGQGILKCSRSIHVFDFLPWSTPGAMTDLAKLLFNDEEIHAHRLKLADFVSWAFDFSQLHTSSSDLFTSSTRVGSAEHLQVVIGYLASILGPYFALDAITSLGILPPVIPAQFGPSPPQHRAERAVATLVGWRWNNPPNLSRALRRDSDFEVLEYLGDGLLELLAAWSTFCHVVARQPEDQRGSLGNQIKCFLVCNETLAWHADAIGLSGMIMPTNMEVHGRGDHIEALAAVTWMDGRRMWGRWVTWAKAFLQWSTTL
ncbi:hypothetical protein HDV00_009743 [Rhizophlyctis rosea]|nr:hypothetical protein HDV00_009743 [Rhizophlyctis rosea]